MIIYKSDSVTEKTTPISRVQALKELGTVLFLLLVETGVLTSGSTVWNVMDGEEAAA